MNNIYELLNIKKLFRNTTVRNGSLFTLFSFFNSGIAFLLLIVIAKYLDPEGYGKINLFNTLVTIIGFVVCLNTYGIISVNYFRQGKIEFSRTVDAVSNITILMTLILLVVILLFNSYIAGWTGLSLKIQIIALVVSTCSVYNNIILNIWRVKEDLHRYGLFSCSFALFSFILTLFLVVCLKQDWEGRINSFLYISIVYLIISIVAIYRFGYFGHKPFKKSYKDCLKFGIPLIPHSISSWLRQGLDRFFLNSFQSVGIVGLFSFSYNFANLIMIIGTAFNSANSVYIYKNLAEGGESVRRRLRKQTLIVVVFFFILSLLVCLFAPIFIDRFFPKYSDCSRYLVFHCSTAFFHCVYLQFVNFLFFFKKTKELMYITFTISLVHVICSFILSKISVLLTLWVGLISGFGIALFVFLISRKYYKII